ncbi:hypothetical protein C2G38_2109098, partial [Gigaspora rosea]
MSKFQTKKFFSIMLFVMLFFVLTKAARKRQGFIGLGQPCNDVSDDRNCDTNICRVKGEDTHRCQVSDERDVEDYCRIGEACKSGECHDGLCRLQL